MHFTPDGVREPIWVSVTLFSLSKLQLGGSSKRLEQNVHMLTQSSRFYSLWQMVTILMMLDYI